jgi:NAD(P)-dependent dehydrogenase (short-subunit alcohol dehydrogenase family)
MSADEQTKFALVTGAAHRVGRLITLSLADLGFDLIIHYHQAERDARETVLEIERMGRTAICLRANLLEPLDIQGMFARLDQSGVSLRMLVNSAAVMKPGSLAEISPADWREMWELNVNAPLWCARETAARMPTGGLIVNICDEFARQSWKVNPAYGLTKTALEDQTRQMALEFTPRGIRVNGLALGPVLPAKGQPADVWQRVVAKSRLGEAIHPEWIQQSLAYLIKNEYISGEIIHPIQVIQ